MEATIHYYIFIILGILLIIVGLFRKHSNNKLFNEIERDKKKASEFTQEILDDVDKVLAELRLSARKDNSISFHTHEAQTIHYSDLDLVISTDAWHMAILRYDDGEITIHSREIKRQEKIKNFFLSINPQEMTYKQIAG